MSEANCREICKVAERPGSISNPELSEIFDILAEWEAVLQAQNIDFEELSRVPRPENANTEPEPQP